MTIRIASVLMGAVLAAGVGAASASESLVLNDSQMDQVSAGALPVPSPSYGIDSYNRIAAFAYSESNAISIMGRKATVDASYTANVGLATNRVTFNVKVTWL